MKDVLIIANYCGNLDGSKNNRFVYIAEMLTARCNVELITSDFYHTQKKFYRANTSAYKSIITFLHETGYNNNISLKRIYSHRVFSKNLKKYLVTRKKPDLIYCAVPTLSAAKVSAEYTSRHKIPFIIDVQDLWPEAFSMFNKYDNFIKRFMFAQMMKTANNIYENADYLIAVSKTYLERATRINTKHKIAKVIYIGADLQQFDEYKNSNNRPQKQNKEIWIGYLGTLGYSYDLFPVFDAITMLISKIKCDIRFIIMGDGPLREEFVKYANIKNIKAEFSGYLSYKEMTEKLCMCDIAINPIKKNSAASIINKHADYAFAGLPVVNTQESVEYKNIIDEYKCGINCKPGNRNEICDALMKLIQDEKLRRKMGFNSRKLGENKFDRNKSYNEIVQLVCDAD